MPKCVNKVTLLGHLGKDPEVKSLPSGDPVANFSLATTYQVKLGDTWEDRTEWHNVAAFGRTAEIARDYLKKGSKLYIEGRLATRSWDDKDTNKKVYRTEVVANNLVLLSGREGSNAGATAGGRTTSSASFDPFDGTEITDNDIPF